jgi:hypothetical protein
LSSLISLSRGRHRLRLDVHRARCHARAATPNGLEVTIDPKQIVTIVLCVLLLPLPYFHRDHRSGLLVVAMSSTHFNSCSSARTRRHLSRSPRTRRRIARRRSWMRCTLPVPTGASPYYPRCHMLRGGNGYLRAKRRTRQAWDAEYGRIGREGNMWWLGSIRANKQVFGDADVVAYVLSFSLFSLSLTFITSAQSRSGRPWTRG